MVYLCPHCGERAVVLESINGFSRLRCSPCRLRFEQPTARPAHLGYTLTSAGDRAPAVRAPERVSDRGAQVIIPIRTLQRVGGLAVRGVVGPRRLQTRRSIARR